MFKPSHKKGIIEDVKLLVEEVNNQNNLLKKINSKQLKKETRKELKLEILKKEGELKKKLHIKKRKESSSFKSWLCNNNEL